MNPLPVVVAVLVLLGFGFVWSACIVAGRADDEAARLMEERQHD